MRTKIEHSSARVKRNFSDRAEKMPGPPLAARRFLIAAIVLANAAGLIALLVASLAPGGWTGAKLAMLAGLIGQAPWIGLGVANGTIGFLRLLRGLPTHPIGMIQTPPTTIVVTVRNEAMAAVLAPLRRLLDGLDAAVGPTDRFAAFVLSDSDPDREAAERQACAADPRLHYRRRTDNRGFKAGNIMDFLDSADAARFEFMLVLDADSEMSADAVLLLASTMQAEPRLAIVQHLTVGLPAVSPFPRLFQFGMRAGMRSWAAGQDWWQGDEGPFWGHNAMVRIAPFRAHARLPVLPGGGTILSHDQVEAALLAGQGWGVRVVAQEDGSREANPTTLPEFLRRDARWLAGNLQYRHLLSLPGLRPMGRWQLLQAILLFAGAPFALVFLAGADWAAATDATSAFPAGPTLALSLAWPVALYSPKLLTYALLLLSRDERTRYGRTAGLLAGIAAETLFTLLLDPIAMVSKAGAMLRLLTGRGTGWPTQDRTATGVPWRMAARAFWPHTLIGLTSALAFAQAGPRALLWALPFIGGLLMAIPFCVATADPRFGHWLRRYGIAAMPEEVSPASSASTANVASQCSPM
jgi:membrane glycosyltransferase